MTAPHSIDTARFLSEQLEQTSPELLRQMLATLINASMSAEAEAVCGAEYGQISADRVNSRNCYRHRNFDTRTGTLDAARREAAHRHLLPGLTPRASSPRRGRPDQRRGDLLPARGVDEADGETTCRNASTEPGALRA